MGCRMRQARTALVVVYESLLRQPEKVEGLPSAKADKQLPTVLSREEVKRLLQATSSLMEEALLTLIYSAGLRVGEAIRLKASDILSDRGQIRVRSGKGKKNRYTVLAGQVLDVLRRYYRRRRPMGRLFPGRNPGELMSERTARRIDTPLKEIFREHTTMRLDQLPNSPLIILMHNGMVSFSSMKYEIASENTECVVVRATGDMEIPGEVTALDEEYVVVKREGKWLIDLDTQSCN